MENELKNTDSINEEFEELINEDEVLRELYNRAKNCNNNINVMISLPTNKTTVSFNKYSSEEKERG